MKTIYKVTHEVHFDRDCKKTVLGYFEDRKVVEEIGGEKVAQSKCGNFKIDEVNLYFGTNDYYISQQEEVRQRALAKLTPEEKRALDLE
jgi:hypothetical protein